MPFPQLWPYKISYNWLFLWDYTVYKWAFVSTYNWYNWGLNSAEPKIHSRCCYIHPIWGEVPKCGNQLYYKKLHAIAAIISVISYEKNVYIYIWYYNMCLIYIFPHGIPCRPTFSHIFPCIFPDVPNVYDLWSTGRCFSNPGSQGDLAVTLQHCVASRADGRC